MPLPRRRYSSLGQSATRSQSERTSDTAGSSILKSVYVGVVPAMGAGGGLGARVSRRALGISSVFLQGLRSSTVPVLPQAEERSGQPTFKRLDGCLLEYRDKVKALEQLNQQLEEQIQHHLNRKASSIRTWDTLRHKWEDIYSQVSEAILDNAQLVLQTENMQASTEDFKDRYENEQTIRKAVEEEISSLYKVIDDANLTKMDLETQIESMKEELKNLAQNHEQDVKVLYNQLVGREMDEPDVPMETSLDQILGYIRSHWEKTIERNRAEMDTYLEYKQPENLSSTLSQEEGELKSLKTECSDAGCKIQSLQAQTESMRALKRGLENSLNDARHWHEIELQNLSSVISKLETELANVHHDIEQQQLDYETLLSNKRRLGLEMETYHGILDGEESQHHPETFSGISAESEMKKRPISAEPQVTVQAGEASGSCNQPEVES